MVMHAVDAQRTRNIIPSAIDKKLDRFRRIVQLKQVMRRWRALTLRRWPSVTGAGGRGGGGSVAVYVGPDRRRFSVPARFLNLPVFAALLERAEEEYGFQPAGGLAIPCDPVFFRWVLDTLGRDKARFAPLGLDALLALFAAGDAASACRTLPPPMPSLHFSQKLGLDRCSSLFPFVRSGRPIHEILNRVTQAEYESL